MNATIGICTLVFGGWVLPAVTPPIDQPSFVVDPRVAASADFAMVGSLPRQGETPPSSRGDSGRLTGQRGQGTAGTRPMPMMPTDPSWSGSRTRGAVPIAAPFRSGPPAPRWSRSSADSRPGSRRPAFQPRSAHMSQRASATGATGVRRPAAHASSVAARKPFSSYRPDPAVSPYLNLFRTDTNANTIDNYNTLVKPFVEQRYVNRRFSSEIHGLDRNSRSQSSAIRRLGEATNSLQGIATPQYYQNFQGFFPGKDDF